MDFWMVIVPTILTLLTSSCQLGVAIYFTQPSSLTLSIGFWPENRTLYTVRAVLDPDDSGRVGYSSEALDPKSHPVNCPHLSIHPDGGTVSILPSHKDSSVKWSKEGILCKFKITAELQGNAGLQNSTKALMTLNLNMTSPSVDASNFEKECSSLSRETLCFGGLNPLELFVMENSLLSLPVAYLGQLSQLCGGPLTNYSFSINGRVTLFPSESIKIVYEIEELSTHLNEDDAGPFAIKSRPSLDREQKDIYNFTITCHSVSNETSKTLDVAIPGKLVVLDQNDNHIESQDGTHHVTVFISFSQSGNDFKPGARLIPSNNEHDDLLSRDADTVELNTISITAVNDTKGILDLAFSRFNNPATKIPSTAILTRIKLTDKVKELTPWEGLYCVSVTLNDTTVIHPHPLMEYTICLHWGQRKDILKTAELQCGKSCIILYASVSVSITIFILALIVYSWKRKSTNKRKTPQSAGVDASDMEMSNGYGGRGGGNRPESEYTGPRRTATNRNGFPSTNAHFNADHFIQVDSKWEVARRDLLLDHVLGEGEFGRVLKGVLLSATGSMHVAVKMLKVDHIEGNKSLRQEFMAEFSLLKQLDHPNVIKLLGACTLSGGPPYLVMEYAEFGSLRSFLRQCRRIERIGHGCTEHWSDNNVQTTKQSSTDLLENGYFVTPQELLGFSWQIAKGMAYLSDMKMVHRDLAARNILLTRSKVCKISDFGLTRDIYVDDAYKKKSKDRVPVKWLAPECLTDELYTSKSDVWAFGILLWELSTLGASPYPGVQTELLYSLLDSGYRMQQPHNCSNEVYSIMRKCWGKHAIDRPSFHELVYELSRLLEDGIEYLKLDLPSVSNPGYDIFFQSESQSESVNPQSLSSTVHPKRRNSSMENLRLIDYEISASDDLLVEIRSKHTYINNPNPSSEPSSDNANSSGYESPITLSTASTN